MKKLTVLSIVAATLLLVGCNESSTGAEAVAAGETKVEAPVAETKTVAAEAKEAASAAVEKTKEAVAEKATEAVDKAKEAASAVAEKATEAKDAATDAVADATGPDGKALYAKCVSCHGADGKTAALGKSAVIAGQAAADLETKIAGYKAGTLNVAGMGALMKGQVATYSDADIKAVSAYIAGM